MANVEKSSTIRSSGRTRDRQNRDDQARVRSAYRGVRSGRVKKVSLAFSGRPPKPFVEISRSSEESGDELPTNGANDTEEEDAYEDTGTDMDCSEGSGGATDKDTPTKEALARRQQSRREVRAKITTHRLARTKDSVRLTPYPKGATATNKAFADKHLQFSSITLLSISVLLGINFLQAKVRPAPLIQLWSVTRHVFRLLRVVSAHPS